MTSERQPLLKSAEISYNAVDKAPSILSTSYSISEEDPLRISQATRRSILAGIWLAQFLSALNLTLVPTMLPSISSEFKKSNQASWIGTSYLLATCTFTPLYGRLSDIMGRRVASQSAVFFAALGVLSCGLSRSMDSLVISRFLSGLGGGGIFTTASIITSDMYGLRSRGFIQSLGGIFYGLGMGLGGPIGGLITDQLGWRAAFLVQIPPFVVALSLISCNLTYITPGSSQSTWNALKRIDYGGSMTLLGMVGSMLAFLGARYHEGNEWTHPSVFIPFLLTLLFLILFLLFELFIAIEPVLPAQLLTQKVPVLVGLSNALVAVCNLSVTYYFPVWFQTVELSSATKAGLHLLPNSVCISIGSVFAGWIMRRSGRYKTLNMTFGILPFLGALLLTQLREDSGLFLKWITIMPLGFGNAVVLQTVFIALVAHLPHSQLAIGAGFTQLVRGLGQVLGLGLSSALFQFRLQAELRVRIAPLGLPPDTAEALIEKILHSSTVVYGLPEALQRAARDSYANSLRAVFVLAACASAGAYLVRIPIPDKELEDATGTRREGEGAR